MFICIVELNSKWKIKFKKNYQSAFSFNFMIYQGAFGSHMEHKIFFSLYRTVLLSKMYGMLSPSHVMSVVPTNHWYRRKTLCVLWKHPFGSGTTLVKHWLNDYIDFAIYSYGSIHSPLKDHPLKVLGKPVLHLLLLFFKSV